MKAAQTIFVAAACLGCTSAFAPESTRLIRQYPFLARDADVVPHQISNRSPTRRAISNDDGNSNQNSETKCWNPHFRKTLGTIASIGMLETSYLTYTKLMSDGQTFCGTDCSSVLNGPYASVAGIPLAALGLMAYTIVAALALGPVVMGTSLSTEEENDNRLWLTAVTTTMGVFSVFLMTLLLGVLKENCPFCILSAVLSIGLAKLSWLGGVPPEDKIKQGVQYSVGGGSVAVVGALVLYLGAPVEDTSAAVNYAGTLAGGNGSTLLASAASSTKDPPPILTSSSPRALQVSTDLAALDAKMYGA